MVLETQKCIHQLPYKTNKINKWDSWNIGKKRRKHTNIEKVELPDMYAIIDQKLKSIIDYHYNH